MRWVPIGLGFFLIFLLTACGDDVTGPDPDPTPTDPDPTPSVTADAGGDGDAVVGFETGADGSASSGSGSVTFNWELTAQPEGSTATLSDTDTATPALLPDLPGTYELTLTASSEGETDTDVATISAIARRVFVDAVNGTDAERNGYLPSTPLQSIAGGLGVVSLNASDAFHQVDTLRVAEGLYDEANGETFPITFPENLIVQGDEAADRNTIHLLSPDVDREPAVILPPGVVMRHLHVENGYTGSDASGDPDALFVTDGASIASSLVQLEDLTLTMSNPGGAALSAGSDIRVDVRGTEDASLVVDGSNVGKAYATRFNTTNTAVVFDYVSFERMGSPTSGGALRIGNASTNHQVTIQNSTIAPGNTPSNTGQAIDLRADQSTLVLENVTVTSSDGTADGTRFVRALNMGNAQPNTNVTVLNSTFEYTANTAVLLRESTWTMTDSRIAGINTQDPDDITFLSKAGIVQLDGALTLRNTTIEDINGSGVIILGPRTPNDEGFVVSLGTEEAPGNNTFAGIEGFDVDDARDADRSVVGEVQAIGNTWSLGSAPRCGESAQDPEETEILIRDEGNAVRWGTGSTEVCSR